MVTVQSRESASVLVTSGQRLVPKNELVQASLQLKETWRWTGERATYGVLGVVFGVRR
jgi:hypothetical protein